MFIGFSYTYPHPFPAKIGDAPYFARTVGADKKLSARCVIRHGEVYLFLSFRGNSHRTYYHVVFARQETGEDSVPFRGDEYRFFFQM